MKYLTMNETRSEVQDKDVGPFWQRIIENLISVLILDCDKPPMKENIDSILP